jgi:integrase
MSGGVGGRYTKKGETVPKRVLPLTDLQVSRAKPGAKDVTLWDGLGLYLVVTPTGGKLWRFKFTYGGRPALMSFGAYPEVSLARAREKRQAARAQLAEGLDPRQAPERAVADSFEAVAREWHGKQLGSWVPSHGEQKLQRLEKEVFPYLGAQAVRAVTAPALLAVLRRVESRGAVDTAHRIRYDCSQIFLYAIATGRAEHDPAAALRKALAPVRNKHYAAPVTPAEVRPLLVAIEGYAGGPVVRAALRLAVYLFVRPGELRHAEWGEIDLVGALWEIPAGKMKMKTAHVVPLPRQVVAILQELQPVTGRSRYVFPSGRSYIRPMSENAVNAALRNMGFGKEVITGHGFRATARTILDEVLHFRPDYIEHQLAHAVLDPNGRAYNRTQFLPERREMMQAWADWLDRLRSAGV